MTSSVIAFDIDGTLTRKPIRDLFRDLSGKRTAQVGIITGRSANDMANFVSRYNLQIDFEETGISKVYPLFKVRAWHHGHDRYVYVGNSILDRFGSPATGWKFIHADDVVEVFR